MDDYLAKPVRPPELDSALRRWLPPAKVASDGVPGETGPTPSAEPATERGAEPTFDPQALVQLKEFGAGDPAFVGQTIELYLELTPPALVEAHEAFRQSDGRTIRRVFHSLKTSCAMVGARRMGALCGDGEIATLKGNLGGAELLLGLVDEEFRRVRHALDAVTLAA